MKVFVINLDSSCERRVFMKKQLTELGLEHEFFPAVDGRKISQGDLTNLCDMKWFKRYTGREMTHAELGCALSHVHIYRKLVEEEISCALILEDDAWITPSLKQIIEALEPDIHSLPADVVLLSECAVSRKKIWQCGFYFMSPVAHAFFTHAYVVTNKGAQILLDRLTPVCHPADAWDWLIKHRLIRIASIYPVLVTQNQAVLGSSTVVGRQISTVQCSFSWFRHKAWRAFWKVFDTAIPLSWHRKF